MSTWRPVCQWYPSTSPRFAVSTTNGSVSARRRNGRAACRMLSDMGKADEARRLQFIESVSWERRMRPVVDAAVT